jgi:diguanylate cyclase (GGDEF)-like protein
MFLSLKRHWEDTQGELNNAFTFFSQEMLRAMRVHPVSGDPADLEAFQAELYALENAMSNGVEPDYLLESAKTLPLAVQNYSARTNRYFRIQAAELHNMLSMMAETIKAVAATSETAATGLVQVERQIEKASQHEDLRRLKTELAGALAAVRAETLRQREETRRTIQTLSRSMDESRQRLAESAAPNRVQGNRDPVTGLQGRLDAENDLAEARQDSHAAAVVLPVDRHTLIQIRFGHEAGDNVLRFLAGYLQSHIRPPDQLFRWSAGAFVAVLRRPLPPDALRVEVSRFASHKLEHTIEHHGRDVLLPISTSWTLLPLSASESTEELIRKIDQFLHNDIHSKDKF